MPGGQTAAGGLGSVRPGASPTLRSRGTLGSREARFFAQVRLFIRRKSRCRCRCWKGGPLGKTPPSLKAAAPPRQRRARWAERAGGPPFPYAPAHPRALVEAWPPAVRDPWPRGPSGDTCLAEGGAKAFTPAALVPPPARPLAPVPLHTGLCHHRALAPRGLRPCCARAAGAQPLPACSVCPGAGAVRGSQLPVIAAHCRGLGPGREAARSRRMGTLLSLGPLSSDTPVSLGLCDLGQARLLWEGLLQAPGRRAASESPLPCCVFRTADSATLQKDRDPPRSCPLAFSTAVCAAASSCHRTT